MLPFKEEPIKSSTPIQEEPIKSSAPVQDANVEQNRTVQDDLQNCDKSIQKANKRKHTIKEKPAVKQRRIIETLMERNEPESNITPTNPSHLALETLPFSPVAEIVNQKPTFNPVTENSSLNLESETIKATTELGRGIPNSPKCHTSKEVEKLAAIKHHVVKGAANPVQMESTPGSKENISHSEIKIKTRSTKTVKELLEEKIIRNLNSKESSLSEAVGSSDNNTTNLPKTKTVVNGIEATNGETTRTRDQEDIIMYSHEHKLKTAYRKHQMAKLEALAKAEAAKSLNNYQMLNGRGLNDPDLNITLLVNPHNEIDRKRIIIRELSSTIYDPPSQKDFHESQPKSKRRRLSNNNKGTQKPANIRRSSSDKTAARQLSSPASNQSFESTSDMNQSFLALVHVASELREQQQKHDSSPVVSPGAHTRMVSSPVASTQLVSPPMTPARMISPPMAPVQMVVSSVHQQQQV